MGFFSSPPPPPEPVPVFHYDDVEKVFGATVGGKAVKPFSRRKLYTHLTVEKNMPHEEANKFIQGLMDAPKIKEKIRTHLHHAKQFRANSRKITHVTVKYRDKKGNVVRTKTERRQTPVSQEMKERRKQYLEKARFHMKQAKDLGYNSKTWKEEIEPVLRNLLQEGVTRDEFFSQYVPEDIDAVRLKQLQRWWFEQRHLSGDEELNEGVIQRLVKKVTAPIRRSKLKARAAGSSNRLLHTSRVKDRTAMSLERSVEHFGTVQKHMSDARDELTKKQHAPFKKGKTKQARVTTKGKMSGAEHSNMMSALHKKKADIELDAHKNRQSAATLRDLSDKHKAIRDKLGSRSKLPKFKSGRPKAAAASESKPAIASSSQPRAIAQSDHIAHLKAARDKFRAKYGKQ